MSKTIKEVYDANPTNRNDSTLDGYIPGDDTANTPVAYNMDQLTAAITHRQGPPVTAHFVVTISENTLTANISPITGTYTHWIITVDDADSPVFGDDPFIQGSLQLTKDLAVWGTPETWRLWIYDWVLQDPATEILAPDDTSGVEVITRDTIAPIGILTLSNGSNADTKINWSIAASDSHSGVDTTKTELIDNSTGLVISVGAASGTIVNLNPSTEYTYSANVYDNNNNIGLVASKSHTTAANTNIAGIIEFTETGNPAYTVAEDVGGGVLAVSLTLTGRTDSDEKACTVSSRAWTTDGTSQVTAWDKELVTFTTDPDVNVDTVNLVLDDESLSENNMVEVYIDYDSAVGDGADDPTIGQNNAILIKITGSGGTETTGYQDYDDGNRQIVVLDTDMPDWTITVPSGGKTDEYELETAPGSDANGPTEAFRHTKSSGQGYVNIDPFPDASSVTIPITLSKTASWYVWVRLYATANNFGTHYCFDSNWVNQAQYGHANTGSTWHWRPVGNFSGDVAAGYSVSAGDHTLHIATREEAVTLWTNQIAICDDVSYDMTALAALTTLSTKGSSEPPTDNPDNPANPIGPPTPLDTVTPTFSPLDNATGVQTNVDLVMTFTDLTGLVFDESKLTVTTGGGFATGTWTSNSVDTLTFRLSTGQSWIGGGAIAVLGSDFGSIVESGVRKSITDIGAGDWNMTAVDNQPADYIQKVDFEEIVGVPRIATNTDIASLFHVEGWDGFWDLDPGVITHFVSDPDGSRGTVMRHTIPQGSSGRIMQTKHHDIVDPSDQSVLREVYAAVDMRVQDGYVAPSSVHFNAIYSAPDHSTHTGTVPDPTEDKCQTQPNFYGSLSGYNGIDDNSLGIYAYHHNYGPGGWAGPMLLNRDNPDIAWRNLYSMPGQMHIPTGKWFTFEWYMKLNSFTGSVPNEDGIIRAWIDGELGVNATNIVLITIDSPTLGINMITHGCWYGGDSAVASRDDTIWRDNFRYSTFPIRH